jgi:hypothetical protein
MAQTGLQNLDWVQGWGVVREADEKLEFVAFFDTQEDAEAAAEAGTDCRVCWLSYQRRPGFSIKQRLSEH